MESIKKKNQDQKSEESESLTDKVLKYETISFNAHPSLTTINLDGWVLRFAPWNTKRANCINPLYNNNDQKTYEKILKCEKIYFSKGKASIFKINDATDPEINKILSEMNYLNCEINYVMNLNLSSFNFDLNEYKTKKNITNSNTIINNKPDDTWLKSYFLFECKKNEKSQKNYINMFNLIKNEQFYVKIEFNEKIVACASCVLEKGIANILNVVTDKNFRGRGFGKFVVIETINEAKRRGGVDAFLYVLKNNNIAINMYKSIGFKKVYSYWYRDKRLSQ